MKTYTRVIDSHLAKSAVLSAISYLDKKKQERKERKAELLLSAFIIAIVLLAIL